MPDPTFVTLQPMIVNGRPNPQGGWIDPTMPLAYNRVVPIETAPEYTEGMVFVFPAATYAPGLRTVNGFSGVPCLVLEESVVDPSSLAPNPPTSWFWNVRVGDKIQIGHAGVWYTIVGPMMQPNPEGFVNNGPAGTTLPTLNGGSPCEYLLLVDGRDDNANGWTDEGFDGVDNNNANGVDEAVEWEVESWQGSLAKGAVNLTYTIRRRPMASPNATEIALPTDMVIDATTLLTSQERSRFPVDLATRMAGTVDIVINPDGTVLPVTSYGVPASFPMGGAFDHFWLAERQDVQVPSGSSTPYLPVAEPGSSSASATAGNYLKGEYSLLSLNARTGQMVVNASPSFYSPISGAYAVSMPFLAAEQGVQAP